MLENWMQYLTSEDYDYIVKFVEDTQNDIDRTDRFMIFYGSGSNGKTTLINEIVDIIGQSKCENLHSLYQSKTIKLLITNDDSNFGMIKQLLSDDKILTRNKNKEYEYRTQNWKIIMETNKIENLEESIKRRAKIITFTHRF